jgi:hypothetical protein
MVLLIEQNLLLDYFQMVTLGRRLRVGCRRNDAIGVKILMIPFVFASLMEAPVFIKVVARAQSAKTQDGFGAGKPPFGSRDFGRD